MGRTFQSLRLSPGGRKQRIEASHLGGGRPFNSRYRQVPWAALTELLAVPPTVESEHERFNGRRSQLDPKPTYVPLEMPMLNERGQPATAASRGNPATHSQRVITRSPRPLAAAATAAASTQAP